MNKLTKKLFGLGLCVASVGTLAACSAPKIVSDKGLVNLKTENTEQQSKLEELNLLIAAKNTELAELNLKIEELENGDSTLVDELKQQQAVLEAEIADLRDQLANTGGVWINNNTSNEVFFDEVDDYLNNVTFNGSTKSARLLTDTPSTGHRKYIFTDRNLYGDYEESGADSVYFLDIYVKDCLQASFGNGSLDYNNAVFYPNDFSFSYIGNKGYITNGFQVHGINASMIDSTGNYIGSISLDANGAINLTEWLMTNRFIDEYQLEISFTGFATLHTADGSDSYYGDMSVRTMVQVNGAPTASELPSA